MQARSYHTSLKKGGLFSIIYGCCPPGSFPEGFSQDVGTSLIFAKACVVNAGNTANESATKH